MRAFKKAVLARGMFNLLLINSYENTSYGATVRLHR